MLHPLEVLGVGHGPGVDALLVARPAGLDLLDLGVDAALLDDEVVERDPGVAGGVVDTPARRRQAGALRELGQAASPVGELVGAGVELGDLEELVLGGRVGSQGGLLCRCGVRRVAG